MTHHLQPLEARRLLSVTMTEVEPNNTTVGANVVTRVLDVHTIVSGRVSAAGDRDWFKIQLKQGDVFGAAVSGNNGLNPAVRLVDASGALIVANDDSQYIGQRALPDESPLPHNQSIYTDAEAYSVITRAGTYFLEVSASADASTGRYNLDIVVARPGLEKQPIGTRQILFLDFDGAKVNFSKYGAEATGTATLSPMAKFLPEWGLTAADENTIIDRVVAGVTDKLSANVRARGLNGDFSRTGVPGQFDIEIRNSRDDADEFGTNPFVSRVAVCGSRAEAGFLDLHIGEAETTDVGNFKTDDEAVATVDIIQFGLSVFPIRKPATVIDFASETLANLAAHEAGHIFGCFHTDQSLGTYTGTPSLMDGDLRGMYGADEVFGTKDDPNIQLVADSYDLNAYFRGLNDTLNTVAFGLSTGKTQAAQSAVEPVPGAAISTFATKRFGFASVLDSINGEASPYSVL
jgi:hypothetical protein